MFELTTVFALTFIANLVAKNALMMFNTFQFTIFLQPTLLIVACVVLLLYFYNLNRTQFASDYKYSTWQNEIRPLRYFIMLIVFLVLCFGAYALQSETLVHSGGRRR
jgi:Na+/H+ antiporter NhaD/arsenite permease-like protein